MKYYKLILDNQIIGVVSSNNFIRYSPLIDCFLRSDEVEGEYIGFQGKLYRTTWMSSIQIQQPYTLVDTVEIEKEEYDIFIEAIKQGHEIKDDPDYEEPIVEPEKDPIDIASVEFIRDSKINEMSRACRAAIEQGFDIALRGKIKHFSLTTQDQLNLMNLGTIAQTQNLIPYHADGEACEFYTSEEINQIIKTYTSFKAYHTTYYNALKTYINTLETIEEIAAITYGTEIPDQYKSDVLKVLEQ